MTAKNFFFLLLLTLADALFAQSGSKEFFNNELQKTADRFRSERPFYKAYSFFRVKQWDSVLVYSGRQSEANQEVNAYCRLLRGISFREKKMFAQARKTFLLIPKTFRFYPVVLSNLGEIALEQNQYQEALRFFSAAEGQSGAYKGSSLYHNIGLCYFHLNQLDRAEPYLKKAMLMQENEKDSVLLTGSYMDMANLYYQQYKDELAIPYFEKAYNWSKKIKHFELKQNAALNMAVVEENRKNPQRALVYRKEYEILRDSLSDQNKVWAVAETEKKYAVGQKQKEITLLQARGKIRETQRNGLFFSSVLLLAFFGTAVYFYRQKVKTNRIILSQKLALDELNATKDRLFSIVSHDLRSSVHALKTSNSKLSENLGTKNYEALGKLLRDNAAMANSTYSLLDNLLNWAMMQTRQSYFQPEPNRLFALVEQAAYNYKPLMADKNIGFENSIGNEVVVFADLDSVKIIFRNLIDNAVKFSQAGDRISVYIQSVNHKHCQVVMKDTGNGMKPETVSQILKNTLTQNQAKSSAGTGLGMQLCQSLIEKNGGQLAIESQPGIGTKITITLPVNT